jgi:hypothetical protein
MALLQTALGADQIVSEAAVPRAGRSIDAIIRVGEPTDLWGPLGPLVAHRTLVVEHEARAPSRRKVHAALGKLSWVVEDDWPDLGHRGARFPLLLFLSVSRPRWVERGALAFEPWEIPGVYRLQWPLETDVVLVHLRGLPDAPGLSLLRLMPTPRDAAEAAAGLDRLRTDPAVVQSTKDRVLEAIMNQQIPATETERWLTIERVRQETLREVARRLLAEGMERADVARLLELRLDELPDLEH